MKKHAVWSACQEHVEDAIDDAVHTYEQSPDVFETKRCQVFGEWRCDYCARESRYIVL